MTKDNHSGALRKSDSFSSSKIDFVGCISHAYVILVETKHEYMMLLGIIK